MPYLGEFVDAFFTSLPFLGIYSALTMTIVLYTVVSRWLLVWFPWMNFAIFFGTMCVMLFVVLCLAYKYIIPSLWSSRSKRMTHLENKIDMIIAGQKEIQRLIKEEKDK